MPADDCRAGSSDPRLDLMWIELMVEVPGTIDLHLDIPDQVLLEGSQLWLTLRCDHQLTGGAGGSPRFSMHFVPPEQALPEALSWRKLLLRTYFSLLSEPRPWGAYAKRPREEFYASSRYAGQCPELFMTIDQCHALAPAMTRCDSTASGFIFAIWMSLARSLRLRNRLRECLPGPGTPGWPGWRCAGSRSGGSTSAWFRRANSEAGWATTRTCISSLSTCRSSRTPESELACSTAPRTGRTGGPGEPPRRPEPPHDGFPPRLRGRHQPSGADGPMVLRRSGLSGTLHGIRPQYGVVDDPHGRWAQALPRRPEWASRTSKPREPKVDGGANPLMWHTALQVADYNRNPRALKVLQEWADTWLKLMSPGQWATEVEVLSGKVVGSQPDRPLYGGYRTQAVTFVWLYGLTGQERYIEPFLHYYRQKNAPLPANEFLGDAFCLGALDSLDQATLRRACSHNPALALYVRTIRSRSFRRRSGSHAARSRRSTRSTTPAVGRTCSPRPISSPTASSRICWSMLRSATWAASAAATSTIPRPPSVGRDSARITRPSSCGTDGIPSKALVYSLASQSMTGRVRFWALSHGQYHLTAGPDADGDFKADKIEIDKSIELARADSIPLTIAPGVVTVVTLDQQRELDPIFARADLAIRGEK